MTTNQYGGNIVCQGPTLSISPFTTFEQLFKTLSGLLAPFYDPTDDDDNGVLITQVIFFYQRNYSGTNKDSYALNFGISATFSIPLDKNFKINVNLLLIHRFYTEASIREQET